MEYTDKIRTEIAQLLEGYEPDDIAIVFHDELIKLLANDPERFAGGYGNSLIYTLDMTKRLVEASNA